MAFLGAVLYGLRPCFAHQADCFIRTRAQLDEQAGGNGSSAAQAALAVDEDVEARPQPVPQCFARDCPGILEFAAGWLSVFDRQVPPLHVPVADGAPKTAHAQDVHFRVGDQTDHGGRSPALNDVEIEIQIARPRSGQPRRIRLARAERDADPTMAAGRSDRTDAQRMAKAGPRLRHVS